MRKLFTAILAFTFIVTAVIVTPTVKRQKANALCMDEPAGYSPGTSVYYFSDSPITEAYENFFSGYGTIVYDAHPYITIQELQYMLYSGYFWGFTPPCMVVLELKAMKPPITLLTNLIKCLRMQQCGIILITPYMSEYGAMVSTDGEDDCFDYVSGVAYDKYALFVQDTVIRVLYDVSFNSQVKNKTTIFMDGRIAGLDGIPTSYDILDICMYQKAFARLLNYMYYGLTIELDDEGGIFEKYFDEENFMKPLYMDLWDEYMESVYNYNDSSLELTSSLDLNYFDSEQTDVDLYRSMWNARLIAGMGSYHWNYMRDYIYDYNDSLDTSHYEGYYALYQDFYQSILNSLYNRNIHIMAHLGGTTYIDLLNWTNLNFDEPFTYTFTSDYRSFGNLFQIGTMYSLDYVYGMGINFLKDNFYDFLKGVQDHWDVVKPQYNILNNFPIFIYEKDPIIWSDDGLTIESNAQMREECSDLGFDDYGDVGDSEPINWDDLEVAMSNYFSRF